MLVFLINAMTVKIVATANNVISNITMNICIVYYFRPNEEMIAFNCERRLERLDNICPSGDPPELYVCPPP